MAQAQIQTTMDRLTGAKVVAILRAKNSAVAISRGQELMRMGCRAIEVTMDSVDLELILTELVRMAGDTCVVGVGTVTTREQMETAARCGAKFALSPVHPEWTGEPFVQSCHRLGVLAVPAAFSPQEIYHSVKCGALCVKIFPAQLWTPAVLKAVKGVGEFGQMNLIPSGGITPDNAEEWLAAGAFAVGMGSRLVGKDVRTPAGDTRALAENKKDWAEQSKARASAMFKHLGLAPSARL